MNDNRSCKNVDANQTEIVKALQEAGAVVDIIGSRLQFHMKLGPDGDVEVTGALPVQMSFSDPPGYQFKLIKGERHEIDTTELIEKYHRQMIASYGIPAMLLGMDKGAGSYSLASESAFKFKQLLEQMRCR